MTSHALQKKETLFFVQDGIWRSASVASDVLLDISPEHILNVLLLEPAFHDELIVAVHWAHSSQFGGQEGEQMFGWTMKPRR